MAGKLGIRKDARGNAIVVKANQIYLVLKGAKRKRKLGRLNHKKRILHVDRKRKIHLFRKGDAYGFNHYLLDRAEKFDHVVLHDEHGTYKIPRKTILEQGKFLQFAQQGFELQIFLDLDTIEKHKISPEQGF